MVAGLRRPFLFVLAYAYIDIVAPQKVSWGLSPVDPHQPHRISGRGGRTGSVAEDERGIRFSPRQFVLLLLLIYCGLTTRTADFPDEALEKRSWVWKALIFALFLPLTARTRLRDRSPRVGHGAFAGYDRDRRRDQDAGWRRRLWPAQAAGEATIPAYHEGSTLSTVAVASISSHSLGGALRHRLQARQAGHALRHRAGIFLQPDPGRHPDPHRADLPRHPDRRYRCAR
jgi:hypothetical protein